MKCVCVLLVAAVASLGCRRDSNTSGVSQENPDDAANEIWFVDTTDASGIDFTHVRGTERHWLPEIMSGGAAWFDYDSDGHIDLYLVQGGEVDQKGELPSNVLYRNRGNGTFEEVTSRAGVEDTGYGMGAAVGDYDADGDLDLYVTNVGPNVLFRNNGDGTFSDVTELTGVGHDGWGTAAAFVDYDADGNLDLLLVNYLRWSPEIEVECKTGDNRRDYCSPVALQAPAMDVLFRNRGDGTFEDVTLKAGLSAAYGNGLGVVVADFNKDGRIDFYVANDGMPNQLWLQQANGRFMDDALLMGCAVNHTGSPEAGMGVAVVDIENDGDLDLFMTHLGKETNTLYVNQGRYFDDATAAAQLASPSVNYTGFGIGFADFDNDRLIDLYVANGRVGRNNEELIEGNVFAEPNQLFQGTGNGKFAEISNAGMTSSRIENTRAAAFADYDNDGDVDVVLVNNGGPARLLNNQSAGNRKALRLLVADELGRTAIGAIVGVRNGETWQWRCVETTYSYLSTNEPIVHFGLGDSNSVDEAVVRWPNGALESFGALKSGLTMHLTRGTGLRK